MSAAKSGRTVIGFGEIVGSPSQLVEVRTVGSGPAGRLPLTPEMLFKACATEPSMEQYTLATQILTQATPRALALEDDGT